MVTEKFSCRDRSERCGDQHRLDFGPGHLVRQCASVAQSGSRDQRLRGAARQGLPWPVRFLRHSASARHRRQLAGDRIHALDVLKADGIGLSTNYGDKWPGDPAYAPVFDELNRRKAVVYFHPTGPNCCRDLIPNVPYVLTELPHDTTRAITSGRTNAIAVLPRLKA
jgi:hypothetical protein